MPNKFRDNLAYLRNAYHQSQGDLAHEINIASGAIGNYESGRNYPAPEILSKIANYYHVSEEQLIHGDFKNFSLEFLPLDDAATAQQFFLVLFPLACSSRALEDNNFKKAYSAHCEFLRLTFNQESQESDIPDKIMDDIFLYYDSIEESRTPESGINYASFFILFTFLMSNDRLLEGVDAYKKNRVSKKDFLKRYFLGNVPQPDSETDVISNEDISELDRDIIRALKIGKRSTSCYDLADFYLALKYIYGIVSNGNRKVINTEIGTEMMQAFAQLGNKYAIRFIKTFN